MKLNVFTDFHHASLLQSFILLFEKRWGGNVFRPIGMEWATEGYWKVYDHPATQAQYLGIGSATPDGTPPLNEVLEHLNITRTEEWLAPKEGLYFCQDIDSGTYNKALTLTAFFQLPIDVVIATLPQHIEPFRKLCELHPSKPKLIYQIGNQWELAAEQTAEIDGIMASARVGVLAVAHIEYHQEFFTEIFCVSKLAPENLISSFVNVFQDFPDFNLFTDIERVMPEYSFKSFGGQCRDGAAHGTKELARMMQRSKFIWHTKAGGDGYGHILHNAAAVGRPLIVKKSYYQGKLGDELLIDGETCLAIDGLSQSEIVDKIRYYSQPDQYQALCGNAYANFKKVVNFDQEALALGQFFQGILDKR